MAPQRVEGGGAGGGEGGRTRRSREEERRGTRKSEEEQGGGERRREEKQEEEEASFACRFQRSSPAVSPALRAQYGGRACSAWPCQAAGQVEQLGG